MVFGEGLIPPPCRTQSDMEKAGHFVVLQSHSRTWGRRLLDRKDLLGSKGREKLMIIIPITIFLVILLLYTAFNSIKKAMLILINVPFGFIGGIIALLISGIYLSVSAIIGFLAIFAIAILNGIVLVSFIDELRVKFPDVDLKTLLKDAALLRLRPVLMTAFTTLFGILPLLYASGVGSEIQYPLSVVITGGIISSTLLTLLVLPAGYYLMYRKKT